MSPGGCSGRAGHLWGSPFLPFVYFFSDCSHLPGVSPPQPGWVLRFWGCSRVVRRGVLGWAGATPGAPCPGDPRARREAPRCGDGAGHGAPGLCAGWGSVSSPSRELWAGGGRGTRLRGAPNPAGSQGCEISEASQGFRGGQKGVKAEGCLFAGEFNMGTGGGGGGPGGKSFPKCARRAWVGCQTLVCVVLLGKRWGTGLGGERLCVSRARDGFGSERFDRRSGRGILLECLPQLRG